MKDTQETNILLHDESTPPTQDRQPPPPTTPSSSSSKFRSNESLLLLLEANLQSQQDRIYHYHHPSKSSSSSSSSSSFRKTNHLITIPPQHSQAQPWERECDLTSERYRENDPYLFYFDLAEEEEEEEQQRPIVMDEQFTQIGTRVWDCSYYMVRWFEYMKQRNLPLVPGFPSNPHKNRNLDNTNSNARKEGHDISQLRILELGAGSGLLSIALAKLFPLRILATEYGPMVSHLTHNCARNNVLSLSSSIPSPKQTEEDILPSNGEVICRALDWYQFPTEPHDDDVFSIPFDIILVCDCTLTPKDSMALLNVMTRWASSSTIWYVGVCNQREGTPLFWKLVKEQFTTVEILASPTFHNAKEQEDSAEHAFSYTSKRQTIARLTL